MTKPEYDKWVKLRISFRSGYALLRYEDGAGHRVIRAPKNFRTSNLTETIAVRVPRLADHYLSRMLMAAPMQRDTTGEIKSFPLVIFVDFDVPAMIQGLFARTPGLEAAELVKNLFPEVSVNEALYQAVQFLPTGKQLPFSLPLRIVVAGEADHYLLTDFETWSWYRDQPTLQTFGMKFQACDRDFKSLPQEQVDILFLDEQADIALLKKNAETLPRLIIALGANAPSKLLDFAYREKISLLTYNDEDPPESIDYFEDLLNSIIHDFPLHEAVALANRKNRLFKGALFTSVEGNHGLRISVGFSSFQAEVDHFQKTANPGEPEAFLKRLPPATRNKIQPILMRQTSAKGYFDEIKYREPFFNREKYGIIPLADQIRYFQEQLRPDYLRLTKDLRDLVNVPSQMEEVRQAQRRVVDATMQQVNAQLQYQNVSQHQPLLHRQTYRLNIHIGQPAPVSLMDKKPDSIDPLLPNPEDKDGHQLEVVLFPKDFKCRSKLRKLITLPLLGGSDTAHFDLDTPGWTGPAQLRFAIFHKNYLLQAFLLEATIADHDDYSSSILLSVKMDVANTAHFTNLNAVPERLLYIGLNSSASQSHSLLIKGEKEVEEIHGLTEAVISGAQQRFAEMLEQAYFTNGNAQRFAVDGSGQSNKNDFDREVRKFARMGREYYSTLFQYGSKGLRAVLQEVKNKKDQTLQIARYAVNYAFPWSLIYDYSLPPEITNTEEHPVCMGQRLDPQHYPDSQRTDGKGCPHNPDLKTFCIDGFWGNRHRIEQLLTADHPADSTVALRTGANKLVYANNLKDRFAAGLTGHIKQDFNVDPLPSSEDLINVLWDEQRRPSCLVVFGHLQTKPVAGEPAEARILTFPKDEWQAQARIPDEKWLFHQLLDERIINDNCWEKEPLPLVLLISCYNATMQVNALGSMIKDFHTAGAAAIVGTECDITSDLAAKFVKDILNGLYRDGLDLGTAIQRFNQSCFQSLNPMPFTFTCFGNTDLKPTLS